MALRDGSLADPGSGMCLQGRGCLAETQCSGAAEKWTRRSPSAAHNCRQTGHAFFAVVI